MSDKRAFISIVLGTLIFYVLAPAVLVFMVDPFQIYHKSFFKKAGFGIKQAYQHAGWINTLLADPAENYHGIVIGSSTMANYTESLINEHLPWGKTLNLSVNGSTPMMQHAIAAYALEKSPDVKHILWDVHYFYVFDPSADFEKNIGLEFPYYLYNDNWLDDAPYIFNESNIHSSLRFLQGNFSEFDAGIEDNGPFYANMMASGGFHFYGPGGSEETSDLPPILDIHRPLPSMDLYKDKKFSSIDLYMLDILLPLCNSDKDINITFSPTTRRYYSTIADLDYLYNQLLMRRYIVSKVSHCDNIKVFAFEHQDWMVANLGYYADNFHYSIEINHAVMKSISHNENRLTEDNIDEYEKYFIESLNAYARHR